MEKETRLGELPESALGCGVRRNGEAALEGQERAVVDDLAPLEGHHVLPCGLAEKPARL
jgi:hypothetical protein